jgi:hypothetical protein
MATLEQIQRVAAKMIYDDAERDKAFQAYTEMYHNGWTLPPEIRQLPWIRRVISSDPHDAVATGVRILSSLPISVKYQPLAPGTDNQVRADMIERILKWQLKSANRRRSKAVEADIAKSSILYDAVAAQVIDLERAIKNKEAMNADTKREKAALRFSRFIVQTYNPQDVHVRYSGIMPEAVLLVQVRHAQEVIDEWGDLARAIPGLEDMATHPDNDWVTYFDFWDYFNRAVWLSEGIMNTIPEAVENQSMVILDKPNDMPFLPWVALMGGSTLELLPEHKYQPLLYAVYTSGAWQTQNIVRTLEVSEVIAHSGSPRFAEEGTNLNATKVNYLSPDRIAKVPPGNTLKPLEPPILDAALANVDAMMAGSIDKSTVSRILQGGEIPPGIAFATLNLLTQTHVGVLRPYKDLAEKGLAEILTIMLLWTEYTGKALLAYSQDKKDKGTQMIINPDEIDPSAIYIEVEMHPDMPTDRQQRVNTATVAVEHLNMPNEWALEEIGIDDPVNAMKVRYKERLLEHKLMLKMQREQMELQMEMQLQMQQVTMAMQAQMAAMQQAQMGGGMGGEQLPESFGPPPTGFDVRPGPGGSPRGQGVNPAGGGQPPAVSNPEATREITSGRDMLGRETL